MNARFARPLAVALTLLLGPAVPAAEPRVDLYGDPLPEGAVARLGTVRFRLPYTGSEVRVSPDGKRIAVITVTHLHVFDADTGRVLRKGQLGRDENGPFAWLPDGRGVVLRSDKPGNPSLVERTGASPRPAAPQTPADREARGKVERPPEDTLFGPVEPVAFSADGRRLAAEFFDPESQGRAVAVWEMAAGKRLGELKRLRHLGPAPDKCVRLLFTGDGTGLGALCASEKEEEHQFILWDLAGGKERCRRTIPTPSREDERRCVAVSPSGKWLAVGLKDGTARLFDLVGDNGPRSFARHARSGGHGLSHGVSAQAFSPDGKLLVTAGLDNMLRGWDPATLEEVRPGRNAGEGVWSIGFSPDGKRVVTAGYGDAVRQWDAATFPAGPLTREAAAAVHRACNERDPARP